MLKVISIVGKKGNGKDFVTNLLKYKLISEFNKDVKYITLATKMKQIISVFTGIEYHLLNNRTFKENYMINLNDFKTAEVDDRLESIHDLDFKSNLNKGRNLWISIRELMQYFGTDVMQKAFGKNIWVNTAIKELSMQNINIITDVRFKHEFESFSNVGSISIKVINPNIKSNDNHSSETELDNTSTDFTIINNWDGSVNNSADLHEQLDNIVNELKMKLWKK